MHERLQKIMAARGLGSRRETEEWIVSGHVRVNGEIARIGDTVDPEVDEILVAGKPLVAQPGLVYIALNKPAGYVTSTRSTHGEAIVSDLVHVASRLVPVGRLDKETSGLLLMTNDGMWLNAVAHPRYQVEREYVAEVLGVPTGSELTELRAGVRLPDGGTTLPARVSLINATLAGGRLRITITEGKKRQIRLMCAAVNHPVLELTRVRFGPVTLERLNEGGWRHLRSTEVRNLAGTV